jgi:hypothetical protein
MAVSHHWASNVDAGRATKVASVSVPGSAEGGVMLRCRMV